MAALNRRRRLLRLLFMLRRRRNARRQQKKVWVRKIFQSRPTRGEYHSLILEMRLGDHESFYRYFHMTPQRFSHLLSLVGPSITRSDTTFRCAISPGERLAITLRFLVTGDSMQTISFSYRVGHSTVCGIVYSTCESLVECASTSIHAETIVASRVGANQPRFRTYMEFPTLCQCH